MRLSRHRAQHPLDRELQGVKNRLLGALTDEGGTRSYLNAFEIEDKMGGLTNPPDLPTYDKEKDDEERWGSRSRGFGLFARHLRFVDRSARKLARQIFHGMVIHQA